jgi:hypothetical protein
VRGIGAYLLLVVLIITLAVPTFARPTDDGHAARRSEKLRQKRWKKFVNRQKNADKKAQKRVKKESRA